MMMRLRTAVAAAAACAGVVDALAVSILYDVWHGFAAQTLANISAAHGSGAVFTVEDVLRSNGNLTLSEMLDAYGLQPAADNFYYHSRPVGTAWNSGFYCLYTKRPNETAGWIPDCQGVNETLALHASQLVSAGVDFLIVDSTNIPTLTRESDVIQVRPQEVLFEGFAALRAAGTPTPSLTAWQTVPTGGTLWQNALALYNAYPDLVYKSPLDGRMVFFVPAAGAGPDPTIVAAIESNGGQNNVVVVRMWANFDPSEYATGLWGFMSPCTDATSGGGYTTSVAGAGATGCGQHTTTNSPLGTCTSVAPSYQLAYSSLPFQSAGKLDGLTFRRQFGTIFDNAAGTVAQWLAAAEDVAAALQQEPNAVDAAADALRAALALQALPDNVNVATWNEWIAQPQPNPWPTSPYAFSAGLPDDSLRGSLWVDTYGAALTRDIEPSATYGTAYYDLLASCLRVVKAADADAAALLALVRSTPLAAGTGEGLDAVRMAATAFLARYGRGARADGLASCSVAGELCCQYDDATDGYAPIWPLTLNGGGDALLTQNPDEVSKLTCAGCGWTETCNAYSGPTQFCVDGSIVTTPTTLQGPFLLHTGGCVGAGGSPQPGRLPLYRCYDGSHHSFGLDDTCGGDGTVESVLGCMDNDRSGNMPRALRKCRVAGGGRVYHVTDGACASGDADGGLLGYVH